MTHLQIYPTNEYTPPVHRLLQVTANIYDATTTNFYPSVFRPIFSTDASGTNIFINGYEQVVSVSGINDPQLAPPVDVSALVSVGMPFTNMAVNVYGLPWIIGAKKGLPGLNQFSMVNAAQFTRKLQVVRDHIGPGANIWTNQMIVMSITNNLGISFWNSYTDDYPTNYAGGLNMSIVVHSEVQSVVTNSDWAAPAFLPRTTADYVVHPTRWPGSKWGAYGSGTPAPTSFFAWQWTNTVVPEAVYNFTTKTFNVFANATNFWDTNRTILDPLPQFGLLTTNWVQAYIVDNSNVIDYVQLRGPINNGNLSAALNDPNSLGPPDYLLWVTNGYYAATTPSWGIIDQMMISSQNVNPPPSARWRNPGVNIPGLDPIAASRVFFAAAFQPSGTCNYAINGSIYTYTNSQLSVQAPYSAVRTVYVPYLYQVNDPLVHYLVSDLDVGRAGVWTGNNLRANGEWGQIDDPTTSPFPTPPTTEIVRGHYQPWGKAVSTVFLSAAYNFDNPYNLVYKDPLVWGSDYWNFPTGQMWNLSWLGRVHRGTPWQTIYLKARDVLHSFGSGVSPNIASGTNTWAAWTGDYNLQDTQWTCPVADRQLVSLLAAMLGTNVLHTQFSVNNPDPNAWASLLGGFIVLTNSANMPPFSIPALFPTEFNPLPISSNSPQTSAIVGDIESLRAVQPFHQIGDILADPILTEQSPFLNWSNPNQIKYGISDEAYEAIPSQLLSLLWLRADSFGSLVSSNGQMQVKFSGYDGYNYIIQASSDLINWINVSTNSPVNGTFYFAVLAPLNSSRQFYRSLLQ